MITRFWTGIARAGTTRADFQRHWRDVHARYGLALPGLRAYVQNHVEEGPDLAWASPAFDGCSELSWDDLAAMRHAFASDEIREADRDERSFADAVRFGVFVGERGTVAGEPQHTPYRVMTFLRTAPRVQKRALADRLADGYAELVQQVGPVHHEVLVAVDDAGEPLVCDVVDTLWFARREDALALADLQWDVGRMLAGYAFGRETALVRPWRLR